MAPHSTLEATGLLFETDDDAHIRPLSEEARKVSERKRSSQKTAWIQVTLFGIIHLIGLYGFVLVFTTAKIWTSLLSFVLFHAGVLGVGAGVHRLWSHRSYKAKWPLRLFLLTLQTMAYQDAVIDWARDHRLHHKFNETDADPHNATRGFFYSHIGWIFMKKHPDVLVKGKTMDFSDLYEDPMLYYQKKYYFYFMLPLCFVLPTYLPMYLWGEAFLPAFSVNILRYICVLNVTLAINSIAHRYGGKPYDRSLNPAESLTVSLITNGEGWHNYHHVFPWDYRTAELGKYGTNYLTTGFLDVMAKIGLAYDLKYATENMISRRVQRTGDGSHEIWGWGDKDQSLEEQREAAIANKKGL